MQVNVVGMSCDHCKRAITQAIGKIAPDAQVVVDVKGGTVSVENGPDQHAVEAAISDAGYKIT